MPQRFPQEAVLRNGARVLIRPFTARDTDALWQFFQRLPKDVQRLAWDHIDDRSVVNEWGRSHDVKNLFIVDGSVFVTGGGVNPTSTIQAVALYIADQIKQRLANLFD